MKNYKWKLEIKGGPGSGHHGHAGRPGKIGGSVPGSKYGSAADALNSAPIGPASRSRSWRKKNQERYENDPDFKVLCDTIALYTQGDYDAVRTFAEYIVTGELPDDAKGTFYEGWIKNNFAMRVLQNPLTEHEAFFEGQNLDSESLTSISALEATAILQKAISDATPLEQPLYRGVTARKRTKVTTREDGTLDYEVLRPPLPKTGEMLDVIGPSSFTADESLAYKFASGRARGQTRSHRDGAAAAEYLAVYKVLPTARFLVTS